MWTTSTLAKNYISTNFKHYWLMQNVAELKNVRAGIFDLERQESKWIERREFLTSVPGAQRSNSRMAATTMRPPLDQVLVIR